ncbi:hypothetical protein BDB00DRAFT_499052 [Zychaea mexicana]|uniref:uncharacterized protein n=1 Tax=Zychaea mexicana TaxID=64656 RepID=UPI0022FF1A49|nr:uncharacterized protein BDB00DRAFT_499052 [Zychaea mexicana]KAI9498106.1 hypothetical protein BDB00DRAFT_499052 [Zychaea mexicana]
MSTTSTTTVRSTAVTPTADTTLLDAATPLLLHTDPALALSALGIATTADTSSEPCLPKPKAASADARHESTSALLPITTTTTTTTQSPHLGIVASSPTMATWQLLLYYQQLLFPPLVKDDVFLGPADNESVITVNSSTDSSSSSNSSTTTTTAPSVGNWAPTPCLSPVTSPSDFLCNHEPLFDGIDDLQHHQQQQQKTLSDQDEQVKVNLNDDDDNDDDNDDDSNHNGQQVVDQVLVEHESGYATQVKHHHSASPNLDWYEFTKEDDGHTTSSVLAGLPTPSPTASENEASLFDEEDDDDEDDEDDQDNKNSRNTNEAFDNEPQIPFEFFSSDDEDEDDDEDDDELLGLSYCAPVAPLLLPPPATFTSAATRSLKRKRSQSIDSITSCESEQEEEENDVPVLQRLHRLRLSEPKQQRRQQQQQQQQQQQRKNKSKPVAKRRAKRHPARGRGVRPKTIACAAYDVQQQQQDDNDDGVHRTIFERLTHAGIDWCRYCGTTEGVNWRPGPWGKRTLCK